MDELKEQLLNANKDVRIAALTILRKQAIKKVDLAGYSEQLVHLLQTDDLDIKLLVFKVAKNYFKYFPVNYNFNADTGENVEMVRMLVNLYLTALKDRVAIVRKEGIYGIDTILSYFGRPENIVDILGESTFAQITRHLRDTGIDLNERGDPITGKGTLTIADKARNIINKYPKHTDFTPVFHDLIPALEQMHFYISNGILDRIYGQKLIDMIVGIFELLMSFFETKLPKPSYPDIYPNYVVELLSFCNDYKYHEISDSSINLIRRQLTRSRTYLKDLVETLMIDDYQNIKDSVVYLLAQVLENGISLKHFATQINDAIAQDKIAYDSLPEILKTRLNHYNEKNKN